VIVRRTGAKRGQSPVWYVYADRTEEQTAIDTGTLTDQSPDARWRHVLAWGFESQEAAEAWISIVGPALEISYSNRGKPLQAKRVA
jgi:hypothetical protein